MEAITFFIFNPCKLFITIIFLSFYCVCSTSVEAKENDPLQFVSNNHVLSFDKKSIHVASKNHMLKMDFVGSNDVVPKEKSLNNVGNASNSGEKIKELDTIIYSELWNGVTVKYEKNKGSIFKSTYTIKEGRNDNPIKSIRLKYNRPVRLDKQGNLIANFDTGEVIDSAPIAWQDINGKRKAVKAGYDITKNDEIGFKVEEYNPSYELQR